jgi:hypothetical protein
MKISTNRRWSLMLITALIAVFCLFQIEAAFSDISNGKSRAEEKGIGTIQYFCPDTCRTWHIDMDDYGYSDWLIYYPPGVPPHEMLSGEWAAAIHYVGIASAPLTMWLTDQFIYPTFMTNSAFGVIAGAVYIVNPTSGQSIINNGQVQITIDVEMKCDGPVAMNTDPLGVPGPGTLYVPSDTCIMFQTYTIQNISGGALDSVYFYQFLHGHPGDNNGNVVTGVYDPTLQPFLNYQNYHYDITMWAQSDFGNMEYIGFSCDDTRPPSSFDMWHFRGHTGRPATGLHDLVEQRTLGMRNVWGPDQTAGAMEWSLGTMAPSQVEIVEVMLTVSNDPIQNRIPSLTNWGILILVILLVMATVFVMMKKRRQAKMTA